MATPTYDPIASTTLSSSAASVTFSSIPTDGTYRDLVIVMQLKSNGTNAWLKFNNSSSGYNSVYAAGNGSAASSSSNSNTSALYIQEVAYTLNTEFSTLLINVMDYSVTDKHKSVLVRNNTVSLGTEMIAGRWANTSAINRVDLTSQYGTVYEAGTTISLYGIVA